MLKYIDYIKEEAGGGDWLTDINNQLRSEGAFSISDDDIIDIFLEFIDNKFNITINRNVMYDDSSFKGRKISNKQEVTNNKCYTGYNIKISKVWSVDNDMDKSIENIENIRNYIIRYKALFNRFITLYNLKVIQNDVAFNSIPNNSSFLEIKICVKEKIIVDKDIIRKISVDKIKKDISEEIEAKLSSNKIFEYSKTSKSGSIIFEITLKDRYIRLKDKIETILLSMTKLYKNVRVYQDADGYKIIVRNDKKI